MSEEELNDRAERLATSLDNFTNELKQFKIWRRRFALWAITWVILVAAAFTSAGIAIASSFGDSSHTAEIVACQNQVNTAFQAASAIRAQDSKESSARLITLLREVEHVTSEKQLKTDITDYVSAVNKVNSVPIPNPSTTCR